MNDKRIKLFVATHIRLCTLAVVVVGLALGYFIRISPARADLQNFGAQVDSIRAQKDELTSTVAQLKSNLEYFSSISSEDQERFATALPSQKTVLPELYAQIDALVKSSGAVIDGLTISELKPQKPKPGQTVSQDAQIAQDSVKTLSLVLKVKTTSWPAAKFLIANIESHLHLMDISSVVYNGKQGALDFSIRTYYTPVNGSN